MSKGYIKLHRQIEDSWLWNEKPFSKGQAWIDLLLLANHSDHKEMRNGELTEYKRGQVCRPMTELAERWGWDRRTVKRFLDVLSADGMLSVTSSANGTTRGTLITIENYGIYQDPVTTKGTTNAQQDVQQVHNTMYNTMYTNKNDQVITKELPKNDKDNASARPHRLSKEDRELLIKRLKEEQQRKRGGAS